MRSRIGVVTEETAAIRAAEQQAWREANPEKAAQRDAFYEAMGLWTGAMVKQESDSMATLLDHLEDGGAIKIPRFGTLRPTNPLSTGQTQP